MIYILYITLIKNVESLPVVLSTPHISLNSTHQRWVASAFRWFHLYRTYWMPHINRSPSPQPRSPSPPPHCKPYYQFWRYQTTKHRANRNSGEIRLKLCYMIFHYSYISAKNKSNNKTTEHKYRQQNTRRNKVKGLFKKTTESKDKAKSR